MVSAACISGCGHMRGIGGIMIRTSQVSLLVLILILAAIPFAGAVPPAGMDSAPSKTSAVSELSPQAGDSAPVDVFEEDGRNGVVPWASIRNIEPMLPLTIDGDPGWGGPAYTESHTIDRATATEWDEDWFKFVVPTNHFNDYTQLSYRFDAFSADPVKDICIDVYAGGVLINKPNEFSGVDPSALVSNDDMAWGRPTGCWSSVTFMPPAPGTYWIRVRPYFNGATFSNHAGGYTFRAKAGQGIRLAGASRIETAIRISQEGWMTYPAASQEATVVIAYARNYPDALTAASLAGACGGPILLTESDHLPSAVLNEIKRLGVRGAYIIGGTSVIDNAVIEDLQLALTPSRIKRIAGASRYDTAIEVFKETRKVRQQKALPDYHTAFLASGTNFPDALAAAPMAYRNGMPILLTRPEVLHPSTATAIAMYGITDVIVAGGTAAVSTAAFNALVDNGMPPNRILRLSGVDRYYTAKVIASWSCDLTGPGARGDGTVGTVNNSDAVLALQNANLNAYTSGARYADALAGGALAGKAFAPLLLTPPTYAHPVLFGADGEGDPGYTKWFADLHVADRLPIRQSYMLGGSAAVNDETFAIIDSNTGWEGGP